jgi:hypothetical protein
MITAMGGKKLPKNGTHFDKTRQFTISSILKLRDGFGPLR